MPLLGQLVHVSTLYNSESFAGYTLTHTSTSR
jgi:hypothetical protein